MIILTYSNGLRNQAKLYYKKDVKNMMEKKTLPIGVFDSGVGGISVLKELVSLMPEEDYLFFGDSAHAPYGTKTLEEVIDLTLKDAAFLYEKGVKAIVVACNTATSAGVKQLREKYKDIPVIGIEPALKPAVLSKELPYVAVMATPMTLREEKFQNLMHRFEEQATIIPLPCPGLVEFIERGELESEALEQYIKDLFAPMQRVDAVVLGCTHYPFIKKMIGKVLGEQVLLFDGGAGTARETRRQLEAFGLRKEKEQKGTVTILNSANEESIVQLCWNLLEI